LAFISFLTLDY